MSGIQIAFTSYAIAALISFFTAAVMAIIVKAMAFAANKKKT
jgi:hypothetical protein